LFQPKLPKHFHTSKNIRLFYLPSEQSALRISIAKKNFKLAVDRNKIKRQIKEIFKINNLIAGQRVVCCSCLQAFW
jgi:ribonuclease P protein component